jgi:hypothetical protein
MVAVQPLDFCGPPLCINLFIHTKRAISEELFLNLIFSVGYIQMLSTIKTTQCLMIGWLMKWKEFWRKSLPDKSTTTRIWLGGWGSEDNHEKSERDNTCPGWDLNWAPPKHKFGTSVRGNLLSSVLFYLSAELVIHYMLLKYNLLNFLWVSMPIRGNYMHESHKE